MTRSAKRLLDFYAGKSWAILEDNLQEMYGIYKAAIERRAIDAEFDPEAVSAKIGRPLDNTRNVITRDGVAIIPVSGPVFRYANLFTEISGATSIEVLATDFRQALDDSRVKAIVLEINSPGGEVDGTSELAQHIFEARGQKPITAYVSYLGASAAYWLASAADEIIVSDTASLGSIGVIGGVCVHKDKNHLEFVSSQSPNKRPDPMTEAGRAQFQSHVDTLADVFISTVARNRDLTAEDVVIAGNQGGLKVGQQAVESGLADRVGTLESVISELSGTKQRPFSLATSGEKLIGVIMADKDKKPEAKAEEKPDLDKTIAEKVAAFFTQRFGAESEKPEATKPDPAIEAAKAQSEANKTALEAANVRIAELEKAARMTRFGVLVKDWIGEKPRHIALLEILALLPEGENSLTFKDHVSNMNAIAEQAKVAGLFTEIGTSQPVEGSTQALVEAEITKLRTEDSKLTQAQAFEKVWSTLKPEARAAYRDEERRTVN